MRTFEFEGKTTEEAIENACRQLNLSKDEMDIEVIEPGSAGIFGLVGGRKATVKVTTTSEQPEPVEETNGLTIAKEALENILNLIPMEGTTVNAEQTDGTISLTINGDKSGLLIGRKGRTLDALQFIVNKIVSKTLEKRIKVVIDSENYRQRRRDSLIQMALRMGDKAKSIRKPVITNLLNPHDRRIIHLALKDDGALDTKSRGEGILKKILIIPK
ncbi:MAG: Jag N-terminal domain-containing protein [Desulfobacteraceae bacterium]|nr:MAG: Jag N-terminal domain-containing protein [Desulfobacteraceae bacterium]